MYSIILGSVPSNLFLCLRSATAIAPHHENRGQLNGLLAKSHIPNLLGLVFSKFMLNSSNSTDKRNLGPSIHDGDDRIRCKHSTNAIEPRKHQADGLLTHYPNAIQPLRPQDLFDASVLISDLLISSRMALPTGGVAALATYFWVARNSPRNS